MLEELLNNQYIEQNIEEIEWLAEKVAHLHPTAILEIGMKHGGTLRVWDNLMLPQNKTNILIGIDYNLEVSWNVNCSKNTIYVIGGNSHDIRVQNATKALLDGRKLDFLFHDGEHTLEAVMQDFMDYVGLIRPGGIMAFHDIGNFPSFLNSLEPNKVEIFYG
jgi:cephalosporin hydroxylase